jgi:flagellar biosynthesis protein FlhG
MKQNKSKTIFAVGGGKGGVGKSIFSVALGCWLAKEGYATALVDLDLGGANLHTYMGITQKTPTIADFILRKVASLEDIMLETTQKNVTLISGAEFIPGMANPAYWMKLKIIRHVRSLPADIIIIDLGAGTHFNTLDFFGMSDRGIVLTAAEPGAILNSYSFIKGALFRNLQQIFKKHADIGPLIDAESKSTEEDSKFTLEWLKAQIEHLDPDMLPMIREIENDFKPALVVNRLAEEQEHVLVKNLVSLCAERLGAAVEHVGNIPDEREITNYLLNIPKFLEIQSAASYINAVKNIADKLLAFFSDKPSDIEGKTDFTDDEVEAIIGFMEGLDDSVFSGSDRKLLKLKMYFKPAEVVAFLMSRGVTHDAFYFKE